MNGFGEPKVPRAQWRVPEHIFICLVTKEVTKVVILEMPSRAL